MKKRGRSKIPQIKFLELAKVTIWLLLLLFAYLGYFADIRVMIQEQCGFYVAGLTDGIIITASVVALLAYCLYWVGKK